MRIDVLYRKWIDSCVEIINLCCRNLKWCIRRGVTKTSKLNISIRWDTHIQWITYKHLNLCVTIKQQISNMLSRYDEMCVCFRVCLCIKEGSSGKSAISVWKCSSYLRKDTFPAGWVSEKASVVKKNTPFHSIFRAMMWTEKRCVTETSTTSSGSTSSSNCSYRYV